MLDSRKKLEEKLSFSYYVRKESDAINEAADVLKRDIIALIKEASKVGKF